MVQRKAPASTDEGKYLTLNKTLRTVNNSFKKNKEKKVEKRFKIIFLLNSLNQDEILNNTTKSYLSFSPTTEDDGKFMVCRAENPVVSGLFLESTWKISVVCEYFRCFPSCLFGRI